MQTQNIYYQDLIQGNILKTLQIRSLAPRSFEQAMQKMGKDEFKKYFLSFGFGEKTGIDLPNEGRNLISNLNTNRDIEFANASFGQGIAMTPISTIRALAILGNGGYIVTPHLVSEIEYKGGINKKIETPLGAQVIKKETSEEITRMLVQVVDKALLGGTVKMPHYSIAAKTGTAQIALPNGKGYYDDRYLHSFFGYFPAYNPKFLIFIYTKNPKGEIPRRGRIPKVAWQLQNRA